MFRRKAQLSVETMIIYGLVILVTLSVVGALMYFNILELGSYLPDRCNLGGSGDLKCEEMQFSGNTLEFGVRNVGQKPVSQLDITVTDEEGVHLSQSYSGSAKKTDGSDIDDSNTLPSGDIASVTIDVSPDEALSGKVLRGSLVTEYKFKDGAIVQKSSGTIRIKAS